MELFCPGDHVTLPRIDHPAFSAEAKSDGPEDNAEAPGQIDAPPADRRHVGRFVRGWHFETLNPATSAMVRERKAVTVKLG